MAMVEPKARAAHRPTSQRVSPRSRGRGTVPCSLTGAIAGYGKW